jgi:uncharacterized membrane protein
MLLLTTIFLILIKAITQPNHLKVMAIWIIWAGALPVMLALAPTQCQPPSVAK